MGKHIFLHIGLRKAASTTIQRSLTRNAALLLEQGILYPETGREDGHHRIGYAYNRSPLRSPDPELLERLVEEITRSPAEKAVLSSEVFYCIPLPNLYKFKAAFPADSRISIIFIARRQDLWLQSLWAQLFKNGQITDSMDAFMERVIRQQRVPDEPVMDHIIYRSNPDFNMWLQSWAEVFGREQIILRVLEKSQVGGDVVDDFLKILGVEDPRRFERENANISPSIKTLEVIGHYTTRLGRKELPGSQPVTFFVANSLRKFATNRGWDTEKPILITRAHYDQLTKTFAASNAAAARAYLDRDALFLEPFEEQPLTRFDMAGLTAEEILSYTGSLLNDLVHNHIFASAMAKYHDLDVLPASQVAAMKTKAERLARRNVALKAELAAVKSSRSWKLIRMLRRWFGGKDAGGHA